MITEIRLELTPRAYGPTPQWAVSRHGRAWICSRGIKAFYNIPKGTTILWLCGSSKVEKDAYKVIRLPHSGICLRDPNRKLPKVYDALVEWILKYKINSVWIELEVKGNENG